MFLPSGWLTPVLPPTEESTWAITVVGTCRSMSHKHQIPAKNLATSPQVRVRRYTVATLCAIVHTAEYLEDDWWH